MHFAQKKVCLQRGLSQSERGSILGAEICEWSVADLVAPLLDALQLPVMPHHVETPKSSLLNQLMRVAEASDFRANVPEISLELNVSRRTIEYLFQDLMGESPRAYFTLRRLNLCKQALTEAKQGVTTVTSIATQYGFYELGRFASAYCRYFGELPSITLRRTNTLSHPILRTSPSPVALTVAVTGPPPA